MSSKRILWATLLMMAATPALSGSHSWAPHQVYSNADGTIQFIEFYNMTAPSENGIATRFAQAEANGNVSATFGSNLVGSTADKYLLVATQGFMDLPGAPTPDLTVPIIDNFVEINGDTLRFWNYTFSWSTMVFGPGALPIGGNDALYKEYNLPNFSTQAANPRNFDGETFAPPAVPSSGTQLTVQKVTNNPEATRLVLAWDDSGCLGAVNHQIVYGFGSQLPSSPGGAFGLEPANAVQQCNITGSPKTWNGIPDPVADSSRLMWFLMLASDEGTREGSWGTDSVGAERVGPGAGGSSAQCGNTTKSLVNTCGQ